MKPIPFTEKAAAIKRVFGHIPSKDLAAVAARITTDNNLYAIMPIVRAYVRHTYSKYDRMLTGQRYGGSRADARATVEPQVEQIILSWR